MSRGSGSFTDMLDKMPSIDAITVAVLAFDAYMLYTQLDYYNTSNIFSVSQNPHIIALQATVALIAVYSLEFLHDKGKNKGSSSDLFG